MRVVLEGGSSGVINVRCVALKVHNSLNLLKERHSDTVTEAMNNAGVENKHGIIQHIIKYLMFS